MQRRRRQKTKENHDESCFKTDSNWLDLVEDDFDLRRKTPFSDPTARAVATLRQTAEKTSLKQPLSDRTKVYHFHFTFKCSLRGGEGGINRASF